MADNPEQDDEIIELTEIVDQALEDPGQEQDAQPVIELTDMESHSADTGLKDKDPEESPASDDLSDLSSDMVEKALERVIEKKFSGKIETILFEVMEKMIAKEIAEINASLQKDLDQIGSD